MNNMNDDITILPYHAGSVECRICGLKFLPELEEDQELHRHEHIRFLRGGLPYELREFIKRAAWEAAECEDGVQGDEGRRQQEIAKRVVAYSYWTRDVSYGIPESEFEPFMDETFAFIDERIAEYEDHAHQNNENNDNIILQKGAGIVECRICSLTFFPHLKEDTERHEHEHRRILCGGWPYDVREFIKRAGYEALRHKPEIEDGSPNRQHEIAKRAIIFAGWARAVSKGIPENDLVAYMAAHFAAMDAKESGDRYQLEKANQAMARWRRYG